MTARRPSWAQLLAPCAAVMAAGLLLACTSSGDGGVGATNNFRSSGVTVDPPQLGGSPPLQYVELVRTTDDRTMACIGVEAVRADDVFAAAFSLTYDQTLLRYTGFDASGGCLGSGGSVLPAQVDATTTPGRLVVGVTRNVANVTTGVPCGSPGPSPLISLCFDVVGTGQFTMNFVGNVALQHPDGSSVIPPSDFFASVITVRQ